LEGVLPYRWERRVLRVHTKGNDKGRSAGGYRRNRFNQPYKGGKGQVLWQLNELNKPDKHELLIGTGALKSLDISVLFKEQFRGMKVPVELPYSPADIVIPAIFLRDGDTGPLYMGYELFSEPLDMKMTENRRFTYEVTLNAPGVIDPEPALKTLQNMADVVNETILRLGTLLP